MNNVVQATGLLSRARRPLLLGLTRFSKEKNDITLTSMQNILS